ncbi:MAG: glycosyltransferase family 2 protein [Patescibacteria group bacterium]|nr:glycosyltransferase family 2 protein [Patescibacteria group bacterium]
MTKIFYAIFLGFATISFYWYFKIFISYRWIKKSRKISLKHSDRYHKNLYALIPVLDEVERIEQTVKYFTNTFKHIKKFRIILISTEKEFELFDKRTQFLLKNLESINQIQLVRDFINLKCKTDIKNIGDNLFDAKEKAKRIINKRENTIKIIKKISRNNPLVKTYHYPKLNGNMSNQLNYAIDLIIKNNKRDNDIFCVYNADSKPHPKTFNWVLQMSKKSNIKVFQQYGNYLGNIQNFKGVISGKILTSAALWQTRWSIGFEIYHALKQLKFKNRKQSFNYPLNYCIGHGLFFTRDIYQNLNGFDTTTHNEDAIFGLKLSYAEELIMPIPYFDESDTPDSVESIYKQKANWFFGPLQSFNYYKKIVGEQVLEKKRDKMRLFILSSKLFSHAVYWVFGPTFMTLSLIIAIYKNSPYFWAVFICESILFLSIPNLLSWLIVDRKKIKLRNSLLGILLGAIPCYLLHGLSSYRTLLKILISKIFNKKVLKEKTEMS